jgi:hypothetical protein
MLGAAERYRIEHYTFMSQIAGRKHKHLATSDLHKLVEGIDGFLIPQRY